MKIYTFHPKMIVKAEYVFGKFKLLLKRELNNLCVIIVEVMMICGMK